MALIEIPDMETLLATSTEASTLLEIFGIDSGAKAVSKLDDFYEHKRSTPSDINEHLPTLLSYAQRPECKSIVECGVRYVVSTYAFAKGLRGKADNQLTLIDPMEGGDVPSFLELCKEEGVNAKFWQMSDIECPAVETDLLFIDTFHIYGQLKRELAHWNLSVRKWIIMHDTTVDALHGEVVRDPYAYNLNSVIEMTGFPEEEITKGLWPAIEEFLAEHPEWRIKARYTNNNGLTVLERIS